MDNLELSEDETVFFFLASALLVVNLCISSRSGLTSGLKRIRQLMQWVRKLSRPQARQTSPSEIRRAYLFREMCARKVLWVQRFISASVAVFALSLASVVFNMWAGNARWMTEPAVWSLALLHLSTLTVHALPSVLTPFRVDLVCFLTNCYVGFWISPLCTPFENVFVLQLIGFCMAQVPAAAIAIHSQVVLLSHMVVVAVVIFRISTETNFATTGPNTISNPRTIVFANIFYAGALWLAHNVACRLVYYTLESTLRENDSNRHLSAASALLDLTCDAVCEIDSDLKLQTHSPKLATMLLRRPGVSLEGRCLTDFIAPGEADRAREILMSQTPSDCAAFAFHTHLVDTYSSKFRTEIFQVKYTMMDGLECHLLGLRDFTDLKSLAGDNATDAIQEEFEEPREDAPSHREPGEVQVSERSYELPPDSDASEPSAFSTTTLERTDRGNGIVEKRVRYADKDAFLQIDMDGEIVEAASAPFCSLVGKNLRESFASDFTRELLHRLCEDAIKWQHQQPNMQIPDQVATFQAMPIYVEDKIVLASGVMKASLTRQGRLNVMICVRGQATSRALHDLTSKTSELGPFSL